MDWVKDEDVKNCMRCNVPFTTLRRKHHCRICKKVFCDSCSSQRLPINKVMERVCKDCFAVEKTKRDQWELITNNGFCSPCGKAISYPDFGCMKRDDGCWSCKEKPYMILDLEKKIWTVKMDEIQEAMIKEEEKKEEKTRAKSRSSSLASTSTQPRKERVTFKDIVSGNISEEVLKASTLSQSQEKVYELERIDGSCQTDERPTVSIPPISYLTINADEIASFRLASQAVTPKKEEEEEILPTIKETSLATFPERSDIIKLTSAVTEASKQYRQKMNLVTERRALRKEEEDDEKEVKEAREMKLKNIIESNELAVDEGKMLLDNCVVNFQNISSRYNKLKAHRVNVSETIPDMEIKVKNAQEQFQTLSHDSLMEIAAQQLVHLQHYRNLSSSYKTMYSEESIFSDDCIKTLMEQQESINQCLNKCITTVSSLMNEFVVLKERCNEFEVRAKRNEENADKTIEEATDVIQSAEKLSFLSEQQLYDMEKQYQLQEKRLLEVQTMLQIKKSENREICRSLKELKQKIEENEERIQKEYENEQWRYLQPPENEYKQEEEESSEIQSTMEVDDSCLSQIHSFLEDWGENKSQYYVNKIEEWLEELLSGKEIASDENTIQINLFTLKQREMFMKRILPMIWKRKNIDCFVQEHQRQEYDYRITVLNKDEAIPAICVPSSQGMNKSDDKKKEEIESEFVLIEKESEDDDEEEIRKSDMDMMKEVVAMNNSSSQLSEGKKKRKVKMINLN